MTHTRYATEDDFRGRLSYQLPDIDGQKIGMGPTPELWDLNAIGHSVFTLRKTLERLEDAGVHIPTVYSLTKDYKAGREQSWEELLKEIDTSVYHLGVIVAELLCEERRPTVDSVYCG